MKHMTAEDHKIAHYFNNCCATLERTIANYDDLFIRANAYKDLKENLNNMWSLRTSQDKNYSRLINQMQNVLLEVEPEEITLEQSKTLLEILEDASGRNSLTNKNIKNYLTKLSQAGYDLFREIR